MGPPGQLDVEGLHLVEDGVDQRVDTRVVGPAIPTGEVEGVQGVERERQLAAVEPRRDQDLAFARQVGFGAHVVRCDRAFGPQDDRRLGLLDDGPSGRHDQAVRLEPLDADAAAKAARVDLLEIGAGRSIGGKGFFTMTGDVAAVTSALDAAAEYIRGKGLLVDKVVIPQPRPEILRDKI